MSSATASGIAGSKTSPSVSPRPARVDAYSRHPLRGPLQGVPIVPAGASAAFVPIDPAYRGARLNHHSPFINVHSGRVDGRVPPRRPRMPPTYRSNTMPVGPGLAVPGAARVGRGAGRTGGAGGGGGGGDHLWSHSPFSQAASRVLIVNPMHIVNLSEHTKSRLIRFIETLKRFSEKWFSHVLLLLFLAIYACLGAYIFISFEAPNEHYEKQAIIDMRLKIVNDSWNARDRLKPAYFELLRMRFEEYERLLNKACALGMSSSSLDNQWTFWGALFYSMTVFTTIGYGHLTPVTFGGRIATMIYAIFGIPILLMVLADLGKLLTRVIKYAFNKLRLMFWRLFRRKGAQKTRKMISDNTNQYIGVARDAFEKGVAYIPYVPQALRSNSLKSTKSNSTDRPRLEPTLPEGENQTTSVIVTSSAPSPAVSPDVESDQKQASNLLSASSGSGKKRRNSSRKKSPASSSNNNNSKEADVDKSDKGATLEMMPTSGAEPSNLDPTASPEAPAFEDIDDEFDLPVSVALALLVMYMMFGAVIFSTWEGWNFFDSLYFVFISMSTIGFGDLVPQHPKRMMATFIYLLFGLALTSMCINVVQEKIHATFLRAKMQIGEKMGLDLEQIMADDYYDDGYDDDEDHICSHDGNDTDDANSNRAASMGRQTSMSGGSEPSSTNNSLKGRKKSTGSSSGKDDKRKVSATAPTNQQQHQLQQERRAQTPSNNDRQSRSPAPDDRQWGPNRKQQPVAPMSASGKLATSNESNNGSSANSSRPSLIKTSHELKMQPANKQDKPVIDQLDEPMPPPRSRWGSGKFSVV